MVTTDETILRTATQRSSDQRFISPPRSPGMGGGGMVHPQSDIGGLKLPGAAGSSTSGCSARASSRSVPTRQVVQRRDPLIGEAERSLAIRDGLPRSRAHALERV